MNKPIRGINLYEFEKVTKMAEKVAGLSEACLMCYIEAHQGDIFEGAFKCLAEESLRLKKRCDRLMQDAEK